MVFYFRVFYINLNRLHALRRPLRNIHIGNEQSSDQQKKYCLMFMGCQKSLML